VTLIKFVQVLASVTLILGAVRIFYLFRARAMRSFAASCGFQYIGPSAPRWRNAPHPMISPLFPVGFSSVCHPSGKPITHVWNVVKGSRSGVPVLVFDSIVGKGRGSSYCTVIASQTEQNPFGTVKGPDRLIQSGGWTILHGIWFLHFSWLMGTNRLEHYGGIAGWVVLRS
jgi:hypothetical protein